MKRPLTEKELIESAESITADRLETLEKQCRLIYRIMNKLSYTKDETLEMMLIADNWEITLGYHLTGLFTQWIRETANQKTQLKKTIGLIIEKAKPVIYQRALEHSKDIRLSR